MTPSTLLKTANITMAGTLIFSLLLIYLLYGTELALGIPTLIFLHILFVVFAALFKVSYVARLTALKQLGRTAD